MRALATFFATALSIAAPFAAAAQTTFVQPTVTLLTDRQATYVGTPFARRLALRLTAPDGEPLRGVLVGFSLEYCVPTPVQRDYCPPPSAYPRFAPGMDAPDPLLHATDERRYAAVRTDADGIARAPTIVAGNLPMETFVSPYILGQQTERGYVSLQFMLEDFWLDQLAPVPVPAMSSFSMSILIALCAAVGGWRLRRVRIS